MSPQKERRPPIHETPEPLRQHLREGTTRWTGRRAPPVDLDLRSRGQERLLLKPSALRRCRRGQRTSTAVIMIMSVSSTAHALLSLRDTRSRFVRCFTMPCSIRDHGVWHAPRDRAHGTSSRPRSRRVRSSATFAALKGREPARCDPQRWTDVSVCMMNGDEDIASGYTAKKKRPDLRSGSADAATNPPTLISIMRRNHAAVRSPWCLSICREHLEPATHSMV